MDKVAKEETCALPFRAGKCSIEYSNKSGIKMSNDQDNNTRLEALRLEHRDLDDVIHRLITDAAPDLLQIQRLKKRKLGLKDQIMRLESRSIPDIIA